MSAQNDQLKSADNLFTPGETNLLICIIKHMRGDIDSDFDAVAKEMDYKSATVAKTRWRQIKAKKLAGADAGQAISPIKKRPSPTKSNENESPKKRSSPSKTDDNPSPKKRGRPPKNVKEETKAKMEVDSDNDVLSELDDAALDAFAG